MHPIEVAPVRRWWFALEDFRPRTAWWLPVAVVLGFAVSAPAHLAAHAALEALGDRRRRLTPSDVQGWKSGPAPARR